MERTYFEDVEYVITEEDGRELPAIKDKDIARLAVEKGLHVIEYKHIRSFTGSIVVKMSVSTQIISPESLGDR